MQIIDHADEAQFWADVYRDRPIAVFQRFGKWHVYLDHVLQHNVVFATAEEAIVWLTGRIDQGIPARLN